jgi:hypothetical protein
MLNTDVSTHEDPSRIRKALTNATWIAFFIMAASSLIGWVGFILWGAAWMIGIV